MMIKIGQEEKAKIVCRCEDKPSKEMTMVPLLAIKISKKNKGGKSCVDKNINYIVANSPAFGERLPHFAGKVGDKK